MSKAIKHETPLQAKSQFLNDFREMANDCWLAVLVQIEDGHIVVKRITTSNFPKGDMAGALGEIALRLHENDFVGKEEKEPDPLPTAFPPQWKPSGNND